MKGVMGNGITELSYSFPRQENINRRQEKANDNSHTDIWKNRILD
jgi:hypothetical protein